MGKSQNVKIILVPPSPDSISSKELLKRIEIESSEILKIDGIKFKKVK